MIATKPWFSDSFAYPHTTLRSIFRSSLRGTGGRLLINNIRSLFFRRRNAWGSSLSCQFCRRNSISLPTLQETAHPTASLLEFLPEGPGTGFLQKKRVPGGLLSAPTEHLAKNRGGLFWLRPQAAFCKKEPPDSRLSKINNPYAKSHVSRDWTSFQKTPIRFRRSNVPIREYGSPHTGIILSLDTFHGPIDLMGP